MTRHDDIPPKRGRDRKAPVSRALGAIVPDARIHAVTGYPERVSLTGATIQRRRPAPHSARRMTQPCQPTMDDQTYPTSYLQFAIAKLQSQLHVCSSARQPDRPG